MTETRHRVKLFFLSGFMALIFYAGVMLGGSDGDWFPWANLAGAVLLAVFGLIGLKLQARIREPAFFCTPLLQCPPGAGHRRIPAST